MAKYLPNLNDVLRSPVDYLYIFASDSFISRLSGVYKSTVQKKKQYQIVWLQRAATENKSDITTWSEAIRQRIIDTYGMKPAEMLERLASGEDVAGKNWAKGVFGVGAVRYEAFSQNNTITVDNTTGKLLQGGQEMAGQTAVYSGSGKVVGYTTTITAADGTTQQYQSTKSGNKYYAGTYSTSAGVTQNADGSEFVPANSESVWQNVATLAPYIQQLIQWIASLFGLNQQRLLTYNNVTTSQRDWVKQRKDSDTLLYFIAGAGIVALLFGKK